MAGRRNLFGRMKSRGAKPKKVSRPLFGEGGPAKVGVAAGGAKAAVPAVGAGSPRPAAKRPFGGGFKGGNSGGASNSVY